MRVILGLGGNLGDVPSVFLQASKELAERFSVLEISRVYRSVPVGPPQPQFWNMAVLVDVDLPLRGLLELCQQMEAGAGRDRDVEIRWGPRPLDVDLLLASGVVCRGPDLVLPHPRLHERAFALVPAAEVAPAWVHPCTGKTLSELAREIVARDPEAVEAAGPLESYRMPDTRIQIPDGGSGA